MRARSLVDQLTRAIKLGCVTLALVTAASPACIYNDYCISVDVAGTQACLFLPDASGTNSEGELIVIEDGLAAVKGCTCLWNEELADLEQADPDSVEYQAFIFAMESAARQRCLELAGELELVTHNCLTTAPLESFLLTEDHCIAGCVYTNYPPSGECPEVCDPLGAFGETGEDTGGSEETGDDDPRLHTVVSAPVPPS